MPVAIRKLIARSPTMWVRGWLKVLGPPFIALTVVVSLLGAAIAWQRNCVFSLGLWILGALGLVAIHFGTSALNDYFDYLSGTDNINVAASIFSGGSRVIQEGLLSPRTLLITGSAFIAIGSIIGVYLAFWRGLLILWLGIIGVILAVGYVHPLINLSKKGLGELAVGLSFGPIMLSGVYYVQAKEINLDILLIGLIMGLLAGSVLWINEIPDYEADKTCGKTNWVVRVGKKKAGYIYALLISLVYILTAAFIYRNILPKSTWIVFFTLFLAVKAVKIALKNYNNVERLLPANALTIALTISFGVILSLAFLAERLFVRIS